MKRIHHLAATCLPLVALLLTTSSVQAQFSFGGGGISFGLPGGRGPHIQLRRQRVPRHVPQTADLPSGGRQGYSFGSDRLRFSVDPRGLFEQTNMRVQPPLQRQRMCQQIGPIVDPTPVEPPLAGAEEPPLATDVELNDSEMNVPLQLTMQAKRAFTAGNYAAATQTMNRVLELAPESAAAYQFRALTHFAQGNYDQAAADVYDTLLRGTLWNWDTIYPLYGNARTYTNQYRDLSVAARADKTSMSEHFLLAYHHLLLGHLAHGEQELQRVLEIQPEETVTAKLLAVVQQLRRQDAVAQR